MARGATARRWPVPPSWWLRQAACIAFNESSGNVHDRASSSSRGLFQFQYGTWVRVGGTGDPADAGRAEQTYRAWLLYCRDGRSWREWSTRADCGLS